MKPIQKLTGKLGQKLRDVEEELGSADIKYVLNSVISAVDLDNLDEEDREDVLDRFEEDEATYGDEEEMDIDMGDDFEEEGEELDMDFGDEGEVDVEDEEIIATESRIRRKLLSKKEKEETNEALKNRIGNLLESYIEQKNPKTKKINPKTYITEKINKVTKVSDALKRCSSVEQEISVKKFIKENKGFNLSGRTKRGSLVFTSKDHKVLIGKNGRVK